MDDRAEPLDATSAALRRELELVEEAIRLVASGDTTRVWLGGLAFGDELLARARGVAALAGLEATPLWPIGERGIGLLIQHSAP